MHDLTAAHRTLPFGTVVRVERRDTGADVRVRINDRGPFDVLDDAERTLETLRRPYPPAVLVECG